MSTNFYLHHPSFAESAHIGKITGGVGNSVNWTTDLSPGGWEDTEALIRFLRSAAVTGRPGWVASEYRELLDFGSMADRIEQCHTRISHKGPFT